MFRNFVSALIAAGVMFTAVTESAVADHKKARAISAKVLEKRLTYLPRVYQKADVLGIPNFENQGAATLIRSRNGISGRMMTNVATAGDPYTLWVVVINNPRACATPFECGLPDLENPATRTSAYNGSGAISAVNGNGGGVINLDFSTTAGPLPEGQFSLFGERPGLHRDRGFRAEIWLVVDIHPPIAPGESWLADLTTTNLDGQGPASNHRIAIFRAVK